MNQRCFAIALLTLLLSCLHVATSYGQLPNCGVTNLIYILDGNTSNIYNYDPAQPTSATNPVLNTIPVLPNSGGLTVNNNINGGTPATTFYIIDNGGTYFYYNGTTWVNTGHTSGNPAAVNPAGGGNYIYNLVGNTGEVYRYDGTANGTLLITIPNYTGPYDLVAECTGNFYALNTNASVMQLQKYSPAGTLLNTYAITGLTAGTGSGGFAINGNIVYVDDGLNNIYTGTISGTTVSFTGPTNIPNSIVFYDFGSCFAGSAGAAVINVDTLYQCLGAPPVSLSANGNGPFVWSVISGNATLSGTSGSTITATATTTSKIRLISADTAICGSPVDTVTLIVPKITLNTGADFTITGCGNFVDVINASASINPSNLTPSYLWSPASAIISGIITLTPTIIPSGLTTYVLTATLPQNQGGCVFTDTVNVNTDNAQPNSAFSYQIRYGCSADTVYFTNTSSNATSYRWFFGDGTSDTATNPVKIYTTQNTYNVQLKSFNKQCVDSITINVDTQHPLEALFTTSADSICQGATVNFTNASNFTTIQGPTRFQWNFGDGTTDTNFSANHTYPNAGIYTVTLTATDWVPCTDTFSKVIVVDSIPYLSFTTSDTVLCEGQGIQFLPNYYPVGLTSLLWDFGDGIQVLNRDTLNHAYDTAGLYTVTLLGSYRLCGDINFVRNIQVHPFPSINLGPDTSVCLNGEPIVLRDRTNFNNPLAKWFWNTGDSNTNTVIARQPGIYTARVTLNGCSASDSVAVFKDCYIDIPNAFTPNNDGVNDYFLPRQLLTKGLTAFSMTIYNRWGQEIFTTTAVDGRGWDGRFNSTEQPEGVYIYRIEATLKTGAVEKYHGNLTLLR